MCVCLELELVSEYETSNQPESRELVKNNEEFCFIERVSAFEPEGVVDYLFW